MSDERPAATRMNLLLTRRKLSRVAKGTELLRRKREALVAELFRLARPAADARIAIERRSRAAYQDLIQALADRGEADLDVAARPDRELDLVMRPGSIWGIPITAIERRSPARRPRAERGAPGPAGPAANAAAVGFETLLDLLLEAAPREALLRRLGDASSQTSRQLNTLELKLGPALSLQIGRIRQTLEEREREDHYRLAQLLRRRASPARR